MNFWNALKERFIEKILLSISTVGIVYLYGAYSELINKQINFVLNAGKENYATVLTNLMNQYLDNVLPIVVFWLLVGITSYFFFFILQNIYYQVENSFAIKFFFTKPVVLRKDNKKITLLKRFLIHLMIILVFVVGLLVIAFAIIPSSVFLQKLLSDEKEIYFIAGIIGTTIYWYLVFTVFHMLAVRLKDKITCTELELEHRG